MPNSRDDGGQEKKSATLKSLLGDAPPLVWLRFFQMVAQQLEGGAAPSMRQVARTLGYSAAFVAHFLDQLEARLHVENRSLVLRPLKGKKSGLQLSERGKALLKDIDELLASYQRLRDSTSSGASANPARITLGTLNWLMPLLTAAAVTDFVGRCAGDAHSPPDLEIKEYQGPQMVTDLGRRVLDLGVGFEWPRFPRDKRNDLSAKVFGDEIRHVAIVPREHPLTQAAAAPIGVEKLRGQTLCMTHTDAGHTFAGLADTVRRSEGGAIVAVGSYGTVAPTVKAFGAQGGFAGRIVGIVPELGVRYKDGTPVDPDLAALDLALEGVEPCRLAVWTRGESLGPLPPAMSTLIECMMRAHESLWIRR